MEANDVAELVGDQMADNGVFAFAKENLIGAAGTERALEHRPNVAGKRIDLLDERLFAGKPLRLAEGLLDIGMELVAEAFFHP